MNVRKTMAKMAKHGELIAVKEGENVRYKRPEKA
jgi:hypothetical protein